SGTSTSPPGAARSTRSCGSGGTRCASTATRSSSAFATRRAERAVPRRPGAVGCWPRPARAVRVPSTDMAAILTSLDAWQRRHSAVAFPVAVVRKFLDDRASNLAALVTYYAFFSVFPLVLVFVSILGYLLQDDPTLRDRIVESAVGRIPVIGTQ